MIGITKRKRKPGRPKKSDDITMIDFILSHLDWTDEQVGNALVPKRNKFYIRYIRTKYHITKKRGRCYRKTNPVD
jgi:hypothetical protein